MLLLTLPNIFYLLHKDFMLPFGSIRSLRFRTWNCVRIISYASTYAVKSFSLLDRVSIIFMLLLMQAKVFSLLDKDFMLLLGSIRLLWWCTKLINVPWNLRKKPAICAITYWYRRYYKSGIVVATFHLVYYLGVTHHDVPGCSNNNWLLILGISSIPSM